MPAWEVNFSADCPHVNGCGYRCMICPQPATGHATVGGGPHNGRCLAIVCPRHASDDGWAEVKSALVTWAGLGLFEADGGPGVNGAPEVWHAPPGGDGGHFDPMHEHEHPPPADLSGWAR
jgi:hypothetical protein